MFIIFGIKRRVSRLATVFAVCSLCQTPAAQAVVRVRVFFSLFFVPVIPLGSTYTTTCTMCGRSVKITREAAGHLTAHSEAVASAQPAPAGASAQPPLPPFAPLQQVRPPSRPGGGGPGDGNDAPAAES